MKRHRTGDGTDSVLEWADSCAAASSQSEILYDYQYENSESTTTARSSSNPTRNVKPNSYQPTTPSPTIRKELSKAMNCLCVAADLMLTAHEGEGVDVVELANAVDDYRQQLEILWRYREFGMEAWRSVIVFCQQALCENMHDEEMTRQQCDCLKKLAQYVCKCAVPSDTKSRDVLNTAKRLARLEGKKRLPKTSFSRGIPMP